MPHDPRHQNPGRTGYPRGGRMRSGADQDRYASGNERRYSADWDEQPSSGGGFEGDRTYPAGGYAEEFGHRRPGSRDLERGQGQRGGDYGSPGQWGREEREERWSGAREPWQTHRDTGEAREGVRAYGGGYFNDPRNPWDRPRDDLGEVSGDYESYGRSRYGAQSGYGRDYGESSGAWPSYGQAGYGQEYHEAYGEQRYGRRQPSVDFGRTGGYGSRGFEGPQGQYRGKGPKGYERSDERLKEVICERLTDDPRIDASDVSIDVKDKVVKLSGSVQDRRSKYEIEDVVAGAGAVKDIENLIRVRSMWEASQSEHEQGTSTSAQRSAMGKSAAPASKRGQS